MLVHLLYIIAFQYYKHTMALRANYMRSVRLRFVNMAFEALFLSYKRLHKTLKGLTTYELFKLNIKLTRDLVYICYIITKYYFEFRGYKEYYYNLKIEEAKETVRNYLASAGVLHQS